MRKEGFSTILAVVIVGSVGLAVVLTLSMLAISSSRINNSYYNSKKAEALINACVARGLMETRKNTSLTGPFSFEIDGEMCNLVISYVGDSKRRIEAWATVRNVTKKIRVNYTIDRNGLVIDEWKEVSDL